LPITDYNKKKKLEVSSTNDSGTTQDKAQPFIIRGTDYTLIDDFESGSSELGWENDSNLSIDTNSNVFGSNSLKFSSSNANLQKSRLIRNTISNDGAVFRTAVKIDNITNSGVDEATFAVKDGSTQIASVRFEGSGDITANNSGNFFDLNTFSANEIVFVEIIVDFSNEQYNVRINGETEATNFGFGDGNTSSSASSADTVELRNITSNSGSTVNAFFDHLTYNVGKDSAASQGEIIVDFTNINSTNPEEDIAVYDENGNLLDYEIESLDTSAETGVIWAYNSWVRDDSVQAQIAYGDNSANTDRQNVTGTWNNTGQNTYAAYHLDETSGQTIDSSSNDNDSINTKGTTFDVSGQFNGARDGDGNDDFVSIPSLPSGTSSYTVIAWVNHDTVNGSDNQHLIRGSSPIMRQAGGVNGDNQYQFFHFDGGFQTIEGVTSLSTDTWFQIALKWDGSTVEAFVDASSEGNVSSNSFSDEGRTHQIFADGLGGGNLDGTIDAVRIFVNETDGSASVSQDWIQADYDASPKAGQVYFSQQAAEATVTDQTVTVPETQTSSTNPDPQINATVNVSIPTSTATTVNPAPTVSPGAAPLNMTASTVSTANPDFTVQPGNTTVQTPVSTSTVSNPDPLVNAFNEITVPETNVATVNPAPTLTVGQTIITPETTVKSTNPDLTVQPGETSLNILVTQVSVTNPEITLDTVTDQVLQVEESTSVQTVNPNFNTVVGAAELQVSETQLRASVQEPSIGLTLQFVSPTNALITNDERFFDMPDHTFTEGDLGDTLTATLKDEVSPDGVDLTGATEIKLVVKDRDSVKVFDKEMSLADKVNGKVEYKWSQGDFIEEPGVYRAKIKVFDSSNEPESFPNDGFRTIEIEEEIS